MILLQNSQYEEAKKWLDDSLPKSAIVSGWLYVNLNRLGDHSANEKAMCYVDRWPNPSMIAGVDVIEMYGVVEYPAFTMYADLNPEKCCIVGEFVFELTQIIGASKPGGVIAYGIPEEWVSACDEANANRLGMSASKRKWPSRAYLLSEDERRRLKEQVLEPPPGYVFDSLNMNDVQFVYDTWPHKYAGADTAIEHRIRYYPSICLRQTNDENRLVAFEMVYESSGIMKHLYTVLEFRRRGLGSLVKWWVVAW